MGWFKSTVCDKKLGRSLGMRLGFHTKQQHFTLSSTYTSSSLFHNIEVSKVAQTGHRSMGSFAMPFSSLVCVGTKQLLLKIAELETRSACMETEAGRADLVVEQKPCQWQISIQPHNPTLHIFRVGLYTERINVIIPTLFPCFLLICYPYMLFGLVCNTKRTITRSSITTD